MRTHYDNLKIIQTAPEEVIQASYKALAMLYHPDKYKGDSKIFQIINQSYEVLSNPIKRKEHDEWIKENVTAVTEEQIVYKDKVVYREKVVEKVVYREKEEIVGNIITHNIFPTQKELETTKVWLIQEAVLILVSLIIWLECYVSIITLISFFTKYNWNMFVGGFLSVLPISIYFFGFAELRKIKVNIKGSAWFWFVFYNVALCLVSWGVYGTHIS